MFLLHPLVKLCDREVACSASDRQGWNFESCVWRAVSSHSSHHPQEDLLAQFSLYVHKGGLKPDSFHFDIDRNVSKHVPKRVIKHFKEPPSVDQELRSLQKAKLKANRCAKRLEKCLTGQFIAKLRDLVQPTWHKKDKSFIQEFGLSIKTNPEKIGHMSNLRWVVGLYLYLKGEKLSTPESQAESFNKYFQSFFSNYDKPSDSLDSEPDNEKKNRPRINYSNWKRSCSNFTAFR